MDAKSKTMPPRVYMDFNPILGWIQEEKLDVALIQLPGFKKEHLKVEIDTHGNVSVNGERPLNDDGKQWQRFSTNFKISANCDINSVDAKFDNNVLRISFPELVTTIIEPAPKPTTDKHSATAAGVYATEATEKEKKADKTNSQKNKELPAPLESLKPSHGKAAFFESFKPSDGRKNLLMNVAVATLMLFGLGFYFKYKFTKAETR